LETSYRFVRSSIESAAETVEPHVAGQQMTAYVDGALGPREREIVQSHIELCQECEEEIADLMRLRDAIALDKAEREPDALAARLPRAPLRPSMMVRIGLAASVIIMISAAAFWVARRQSRVEINELRTQVEKLRGENDALRATAPPGNDSKIVLELKDAGRVITLDDRGELAGLESSLERQYRESVGDLLTTGRLDLPAIIAQLRRKPEVMMGNDADKRHFRLTDPVGIVVESDRPTFRWEALEGAAGYEVSVSDDGGEVATSPVISRIDWQPPARLPRGRLYHWQVRAMTRDGGEIKSPPAGQGDARFKILESNKLDELNLMRKAYAGSHLMLGTIYANAGLIDQAEQEFRALRDENPQSDIVTRILDNLKPANRR
jgi:hypothetical protein